MKAVKKLIEVDKNKSIKIDSLPFKPGSRVEVIVIPFEGESKTGADIFNFIDEVTKKKKILPMSMKEVEKVVHEVRGIK